MTLPDPAEQLRLTAAVVVGHDGAVLTFSGPRWLDGGGIRDVGVDLAVGRLSAHAVIHSEYDDGFGGLLRFFAGMAHDWRGWDGHRSYESVDHDLRIVATHTGSHVVLDVVVRSLDEEWSASAALTVEPGEELTAIARDLRSLLTRP